MQTLNFTLTQINNDEVEFDFNFDQVFVIGYSGRDEEKTKQHIDELEKELGVAPPKRIPTIFECSEQSVTQQEQLKFVGNRTSGEAEYVILKQGNNLYIGLGSDHTDRELESVSVPKSKQVCLKPIAPKVWNYNMVKMHCDSIQLNSYVTVNGEEQRYQQGTLGDILPVERILDELNSRVGDIDNAIIFSGTVPLLEGFKFGEYFRAELIDNKLGNKIEFGYHINVISEEER